MRVTSLFAQVEVDRRQVNLTRFPLYLPEKREFWGIFGFAQGEITRSSRCVDEAGGIFTDVNVPQLCYSQKIGLEEGRIVPIVVARLTGKVGAFDLVALNIHTGEETVSASGPTNLTVLRFRRDVLRRSSVGAIFTDRSVSRFAPGSSQEACFRPRERDYESGSRPRLIRKTWPSGWRTCVSRTCQGMSVGGQVTSRS